MSQWDDLLNNVINTITTPKWSAPPVAMSQVQTPTLLPPFVKDWIQKIQAGVNGGTQAAGTAVQAAAGTITNPITDNITAVVTKVEADIHNATQTAYTSFKSGVIWVVLIVMFLIGIYILIAPSNGDTPPIIIPE